MRSASRGREHAPRFLEVRMPSGCGCVHGPVSSLFQLLLNMIPGTSKAQSKEDGLRPRGRAAGSRERRRGIITSVPPAVCAGYTGPRHQCVTTPQWGGDTCQSRRESCAAYARFVSRLTPSYWPHSSRRSLFWMAARRRVAGVRGSFGTKTIIQKFWRLAGQ